jgi:hypothetical protein
VHGIQRPLREHVHPRGAARGSTRDVIKPIQITREVAEGIATALRSSDTDAEYARCEALRVLNQRRRTITGKLDRGDDDFVSGRISDEFWARKSREWKRSCRPSMFRPTLSRSIYSCAVTKLDVGGVDGTRTR